VGSFVWWFWDVKRPTWRITSIHQKLNLQHVPPSFPSRLWLLCTWEGGNLSAPRASVKCKQKAGDQRSLGMAHSIGKQESRKQMPVFFLKWCKIKIKWRYCGVFPGPPDVPSRVTLDVIGPTSVKIRLQENESGENAISTKYKSKMTHLNIVWGVWTCWTGGGNLKLGTPPPV